MAQDPFKYFRIEAQELLEQFSKGILELEQGQDTTQTTQKILRVAHTFKGAARVVKQPAIAEHAHAIEGLLQPFREASERVPQPIIEQLLQRTAEIRELSSRLDAPPGAGPAPATAKAAAPAEEAVRTLRADVAELDELLEGIGETHTQLRALQKSAAGVERTRQLGELLIDQLTRQGGREPGRQGAFDRIGAIAAELQGSVVALEQRFGAGIEQVQRELGQVRAAAERLRLLPAGGLFTSLERSARDAAQALGKAIEFDAQGGEVRLDAHVLEVVRGALLQLIRNAVAHGIESPAERKAAGKPNAGKLSIRIHRRGRSVTFACRDDGRGIDLEAVRRNLQRRGVGAGGGDGGELGREELLRQLLRGGISTSTSVTEVAGRGIGLDVVRSAAERLGGEVGIDTRANQGTSFELVIPLSVASLEGLLVEAGGMLASIPLDSVRRTLRIEPSQVSRTERGESTICDGQAIPFVALARALQPRAGPQPERTRAWSAVVLEAEGRAAIGVDRLLGTTTLVLRPLPAHAPADPIVAGASIDADGNPRLVIDPEQLVLRARSGGFNAAAPRQARRSILVIDDSMTTRMLEQSILESAGYDVDTASSAEDGLVRARQKRYSLFLVDVEMPGMDGFTFVQQVRADPDLGKVPAIMVTSLSAPEHLQRGLEVGAQGYVIKSEFDQADLLERIRKCMG